MCSHLPVKGNLEINIRNYLTCSYDLGYDLDSYFTKSQQIKMFDRLLSCDTNFKEEWESGMYSIPEDPLQTTRLSSYIKIQSRSKKLSRKMTRHIYDNKLTEGAKNSLQHYMIRESQEYMKEGKDRDIDKRMKEIFCGIYKQINDRKQSVLSKKVPEELAKEIFAFLPKGGKTKRKKTKKRNRKTLKNIK